MRDAESGVRRALLPWFAGGRLGRRDRGAAAGTGRGTGTLLAGAAAAVGVPPGALLGRRQGRRGRSPGPRAWLGHARAQGHGRVAGGGLMRTGTLALVALLTLVAGRARAEGSKPSLWTGSARVATLSLNDTVSFGALSGVLQYRTLGWLRFGAAPTLVRATTGATTKSGFGDLPLALEASHEWDTALQPELGATLILTLPTGNAACGLGNEQTASARSIATGFAPPHRADRSPCARASAEGA